MEHKFLWLWIIFKDIFCWFLVVSVGGGVVVQRNANKAISYQSEVMFLNVIASVSIWALQKEERGAWVCDIKQKEIQAIYPLEG